MSLFPLMQTRENAKLQDETFLQLLITEVDTQQLSLSFLVHFQVDVSLGRDKIPGFTRLRPLTDFCQLVSHVSSLFCKLRRAGCPCCSKMWEAAGAANRMTGWKNCRKRPEFNGMGWLPRLMPENRIRKSLTRFAERRCPCNLPSRPRKGDELLTISSDVLAGTHQCFDHKRSFSRERVGSLGATGEEIAAIPATQSPARSVPHPLRVQVPRLFARLVQQSGYEHDTTDAEPEQGERSSSLSPGIPSRKTNRRTKHGNPPSRFRRSAAIYRTAPHEPRPFVTTYSH
jgi:hypothetical protein